MAVDSLTFKSANDLVTFLNANPDLDLGAIRYDSRMGRWFVFTGWAGEGTGLAKVTFVPTGFLDLTDSQISWAAGTRTLSIQPTGDSYVYYYRGIKITKTGVDSVVIPNTTGLYYTYFDSDAELQYGADPISFGSGAFVATVYWNALAGVGFIGEERHGVTMDWVTHAYLHDTVGALYVSGFGISGYTLSTPTDAAVTFGLSSGAFTDEDLLFNVVSTATPTNPFEQDLADPAQVPVYYRDGAGGPWKKDAATDFAFKNTASGRVNYNLNTGGTWSQQEAPNGHHIAYWIVATGDWTEPIISVQGQRSDLILTDAKENNGLESVDFGLLPFAEMRILYRLLVQTNTGYGGTRKAQLSDVADFRTTGGFAGAAVQAQSHAGLADLTTSGHPAAVISADTTNFDVILSSADNTVQKALETLDVIPYGVTGSRPTGLGSAQTGYQYFDTTLGYPIWWNGSGWVDAAGTGV